MPEYRVSQQKRAGKTSVNVGQSQAKQTNKNKNETDDKHRLYRPTFSLLLARV